MGKTHAIGAIGAIGNEWNEPSLLKGTQHVFFGGSFHVPFAYLSPGSWFSDLEELESTRKSVAHLRHVAVGLRAFAFAAAIRAGRRAPGTLSSSPGRPASSSGRGAAPMRASWVFWVRLEMKEPGSRR